jgi:predicted dehydrogenase
VQEFLQSIEALNHRSTDPTHWQVKPYIGADFQRHMLLEPPGNIVVISGRNNGKIESILSSIRAGQHVLADKPWIIDSKELPALDASLSLAAKRHLIAFDCMTERFNIAYRIQRELMRDREVFGTPLTGSASEPAVVLQNLHSVLKFNHGNVNLRPTWFFDVRQQGEAIADVGTHLVDLEMWTLFPEQALDYRHDVRVVSATNTPIFISREQFQRVTGARQWPQFLENKVHNDELEYDSNNTAVFMMRGVYTGISDRWEYDSKGALNDSYLVLYKGTRATVRVRQTKLENYLPEIDVIPAPGQEVAVRDALTKRIKEISGVFPNLSLRPNGNGIRVVIPKEEREGSTFGQLVACFLGYVNHPETYPKWEQPNMLTKYYITTRAAELAKTPTNADAALSPASRAAVHTR